MKKYVRFLYEHESGSGAWARAFSKSTDTPPKKFDPQNPPSTYSPEHQDSKEKLQAKEDVVWAYQICMNLIKNDDPKKLLENFKYLQGVIRSAQELWLWYDDFHYLGDNGEQVFVTNEKVAALRSKVVLNNPNYVDYKKAVPVIGASGSPLEKSVNKQMHAARDELKQRSRVDLIRGWQEYGEPEHIVLNGHLSITIRDIVYKQLSKNTRSLIIEKTMESLDTDQRGSPDFSELLSNNIRAILDDYIKNSTAHNSPGDPFPHGSDKKDPISIAISWELSSIEDFSHEVYKNSNLYVDMALSKLSYEEKQSLYEEAKKRARTPTSDRTDNSFGTYEPSPDEVIKQVVIIMEEKIMTGIESDFRKYDQYTKEADYFTRLTSEEKWNLLNRARKAIDIEKWGIYRQTGHFLQDEKGRSIDSDSNSIIIPHIANIMRSGQTKQSTSDKLSWLKKLLPEWAK